MLMRVSYSYLSSISLQNWKKETAGTSSSNHLQKSRCRRDTFKEVFTFLRFHRPQRADQGDELGDFAGDGALHGVGGGFLDQRIDASSLF